MQILSIKAGKTDWRPRDRFRLFRKFKIITISCAPTLSMQFDYGQDMDWKDWKKIAGVSFCSVRYWLNSFVHNRDAIHFAWRWNEALQVHEFCTYTNENRYHRARERSDQLIRIKAGQVAKMVIERTRRTEYKVYLLEEKQTTADVNPVTINPRFMPDWCVLSGAWYGGANNAPGPHGGKAPQDMEMKRKILIE